MKKEKFNRNLRKIAKQLVPEFPVTSFTMVKDERGRYTGIRAELNFQICNSRQTWEKDKVGNRFKDKDLYTTQAIESELAFGKSLRGEKFRMSNLELRSDESFVWNFAKNVMMVSRCVDCVIFEPSAITVYAILDHKFGDNTLHQYWSYICSDIQSNIRNILMMAFEETITFDFSKDYGFPEAQKQARELVEKYKKENPSKPAKKEKVKVGNKKDENKDSVLNLIVLKT